MTHHEFLQLICRAVNKPGVVLTLDTYDHALVNGLKRIDPQLHQAATEDIGTHNPTTNRTEFRTPQLLHYLERNWPEQTPTEDRSPECPTSTETSPTPSKPTNTTAPTTP